MILTGPSLRLRISSGAIGVQPFRTHQINPASYDVTLHPLVKVYVRVTSRSWRLPWAPKGWELRRRGGWLDWLADAVGGPVAVMDAASPLPTHGLEIEHGEPFLLRPGILYLMATAERIAARDHVLVVDGKSSIGRLGIKVHETAGYIDPGFDGHVTLEVTAQYPTIIYGGMRIGQIRAHTLDGDVEPYAGHYRGAAADGPQESMVAEQLRKDGLIR